MKAVVYDKFGPPDVLEFKDVDKPTPKDNEILLKVHATSVNAIDMIFRSGASLLFGFTKVMAGFRKPKVNILGFDASGEVDSVGNKVTKFKKGDLVYGAAMLPGGNAEYYRIAEERAALKPANMTHIEAAAVPDAACVAYSALIDKVSIQEGQKVLIYGASGGVGTFAIQVARLFTTEVTAVCSTDKISNAKELGAKEIIDYTQENFTTNGQVYDIIFDAVGRKKITYKDCKKSLTKKGIYITVDLEAVLFKYMFNKRVIGIFAPVNTQILDFLREQIEARKIKSIVEKTFPLSQTADAHRYYEKGHLKGKVVISVINNN